MTPANCIGLRTGRRISGEPYLHGVADRAFTVTAGARVQLRRMRPHDTDDGPAFVLVFASPDPRGLSREAQARAVADNASPIRNDPRDAGTTEPAPC